MHGCDDFDVPGPNAKDHAEGKPGKLALAQISVHLSLDLGMPLNAAQNILQGIQESDF